MNESLVIQNAGLVILWPYFNVLFERAGLMEESKFIDDKAQQKAVLLLEYLAAESESPEEHQLVFNKILCNYPIEKPIDVTLEITEDLQSLCQGLLEAAVNHWEILGETSIDAFRESFLIREGSLEETQEYWRLKVANKSYDVLMRQLPWGISLVNLSWMDKNIEVAWN